MRQTRTSPLPHRIDALECIWAFHHYNIVKMPSDYLKGWTKQIVFHVIFQVLAVLQTWIFVGILCTGGHDNISMVLYITFYLSKKIGLRRSCNSKADCISERATARPELHDTVFLADYFPYQICVLVTRYHDNRVRGTA